MASNFEVTINLGNGAELGMTKDKNIVLRQEYAPGLHCNVHLGRCTKKRLEEIQGNLGKLKVHCIIED
jgi:hypothetical protein